MGERGERGEGCRIYGADTSRGGNSNKSINDRKGQQQARPRSPSGSSQQWERLVVVLDNRERRKNNDPRSFVDGVPPVIKELLAMDAKQRARDNSFLPRIGTDTYDLTLGDFAFHGILSPARGGGVEERIEQVLCLMERKRLGDLVSRSARRGGNPPAHAEQAQRLSQSRVGYAFMLLEGDIEIVGGYQAFDKRHDEQDRNPYLVEEQADLLDLLARFVVAPHAYGFEGLRVLLTNDGQLTCRLISTISLILSHSSPGAPPAKLPWSRSFGIDARKVKTDGSKRKASQRRAELRATLIDAGLSHDEADALAMRFNLETLRRTFDLCDKTELRIPLLAHVVGEEASAKAWRAVCCEHEVDMMPVLVNPASPEEEDKRRTLRLRVSRSLSRMFSEQAKIEGLGMHLEVFGELEGGDTKEAKKSEKQDGEGGGERQRTPYAEMFAIRNCSGSRRGQSSTIRAYWVEWEFVFGHVMKVLEAVGEGMGVVDLAHQAMQSMIDWDLEAEDAEACRRRPLLPRRERIRRVVIFPSSLSRAVEKWKRRVERSMGAGVPIYSSMIEICRTLIVLFNMREDYSATNFRMQKQAKAFLQTLAMVTRSDSLIVCRSTL